MNRLLIELIVGLLCGMFLGITGIAPTGLVILALDYFKIDNYITNLGTILFINLFPITIGSVWEFYKAKRIDFSLGIVLLLSTMTGGYFGSKLVVDDRYKLSEKTIKYITSALGFVIGIVFFISAYNEKNKNK